MKKIAKYLNDLNFYSSDAKPKTGRNRHRTSYTPTKEDISAELLKEAAENVVKLKNIDENLQKEIKKLELLLEDTVRVVEEPSITGMEIYRTCVRPLTDEELVSVIKVNAQVKKELSLQNAKNLFDENFNFEAGK